MNTQPANKIPVIIIGILLITNIVTISFFLMNKKKHDAARRDNWKTMMSNYLTNDIGFSKEQFNRFDSIEKQHHSMFTPMLDDISKNKEAIYKELASNNFNDSTFLRAAAGLSEQHMRFELTMLHHMKDIRDICSPAQQRVFDTSFFKMLLRGRGDKGKGRKQ